MTILMLTSFINRFLAKKRFATDIPDDANKLRLSAEAFRMLLKYVDLPPSFVSSLTQLHLPFGQGLSHPMICSPQGPLRIWYILPVRVQVRCTDTATAHTSSVAGNNQMNAANYLHLASPQTDIRGSHIAVYGEYSHDGKSSKTISFNFMHGRWSKTARDPKRRLEQSLRQTRERGIVEHPFHIHVIHISSGIRWFSHALANIYEELVAHEKSLQNNTKGRNAENTDFYTSVNKALHSLAAHLQRYGSELEHIETIRSSLLRLISHLAPPSTADSQLHDLIAGLESLSSETASLKMLLAELREKTTNIVALLFNTIQIANDDRMVANGDKQHAILLATQKESEYSRLIADKQGQLAEEMKEDSVAMKTIAVTTMFFLPGTSFAALMSMPFITNSSYIQRPQQIWVWLICTIPSTIAAFAFYFYWQRLDARRRAESNSALAQASQ